MARQARSKSKTGIYHVILRGNERKSVFQDDEDKDRFAEVILQKKEAAGSHLYAYCVMDNHAHMVIQEFENGQPLETLMKRIGVTYASYFNKKYKRIGHVFQDRFRSENIEDEAYLLSVIRYIHQNPVKAGILQGLNYSWSSYSRYTGLDQKLPLLPEMVDILDQLSVDRMTAIKSFITAHREDEKHVFIDVTEANDSEENAEAILEKFLLSYNLLKEDLNKNENRGRLIELIQTLVCKSRISGRQVADLTGLNREKVRKIIMSLEPSPRQRIAKLNELQ